MNSLALIALASSIPFFFLLFWVLPKPRAAIASFLIAWLFLPVIIYPIEGLPDISKLFVTCFGILLATLIFDFKQVSRFRPQLIDIPMAIWCLTPIGSSIFNGLGVYDGLSESFRQIIAWGSPYFIGRLYINDWEDIHELAKGMILAGIAYTPFLVIEMRLSPQFHRWVYGEHQHQFVQTIRFGGYRPMVFMHHGLMLAFFMMVVSLLAVWMWRAGSIKPIKVGRWRITFLVVALSLIIVTVFMRSVNAWVWFGLGISILFISHRWRSAIPLILFIALTLAYTAIQGSSIWPTEAAVDFVTGLIGPVRAQSLEFRYFNEEFLMAKARQQLWFGWGGWDRQHIFFEWGARTVADALWVITLGKFGLVGLASMLLSMILPSLVFMRRYPPWLWLHPTVAPGAVLTVVLVLYTMDGLLNAMLNPIYMVAAGGLMGAYLGYPQHADDASPSGDATIDENKPITSHSPIPAMPVSQTDYHS